MPNPALTTSVVICTRNRAESLDLCLRHLAQQTHQADQVVVVDNSDLAKREEIEALVQGRAELVYYDGPLGSLPAMRNVGLKASTGEVVAYIDDDGYADPEWLAQLLDTYSNYPDAAGVGSRIVQGSEETHGPGGVYNCGRFSVARGPYGNCNYICDHVFEVEQYQGTSMSFRRDAILAMGGWDPKINGGYGSYEDLSICLGIKRNGGKLYFNPSSIMVHGLVPRENGIPRDKSSSPQFALFNQKCYSYLQLKYGMSPHQLLMTFTSVLYNIKRCLLPRNRSIPLSTRIASSLATIKGFFAGLRMAQASIREPESRFEAWLNPSKVV